MNRIKLPLTAVVLATALSGCIFVDGDHDWDNKDWRHEQNANLDKISELEMGATRSSVKAELGTPHYTEAFVQQGQEYRVLYYRTQHRHADGETSKDETTPLVFKEDQLIGWGEDVLSAIR